MDKSNAHTNAPITTELTLAYIKAYEGNSGGVGPTVSEVLRHFGTSSSIRGNSVYDALASLMRCGLIEDEWDTKSGKTRPPRQFGALERTLNTI